MKRKFRVTVIFNITHPNVKKTLDVDFDATTTKQEAVETTTVNGVICIGEKRTFYYNGNAKSTQNSVVKGLTGWLNGWQSLKNRFKIVSVDEVTEPLDRYYFNSESDPESVCNDYFGTLEEAREIAQRVANEIGEDVYVNSCTTEEIEDVVYPDEPEQAAAETKVTQVAEPKNTYEHAVEMAKQDSSNKSHTALQEGLNHTKVFYKGEWRVLVLFLPIKGGHDFADRCEIRALPENSYEDIATSLENGKHGFSEWFLYDPETTNKRLKRYQKAAMKKFTAKTGLQIDSMIVEPEQEKSETASIQCGEIKIKPTTPEQEKYISMIQNIEQMAKMRYYVHIADDFTIEVTICEHDLSSQSDFMNLWKKAGYITETHDTHINIQCYYTDYSGQSWERYNPTVTKDHKINFETLRPYTPENLAELLAMAIKAYEDDSQLLAVDVNGEVPRIFDYQLKGQTGEELLRIAVDNAMKCASRARMDALRYPNNADYWNEQAEIYENADYRVMRYSEFERLQRERIIKKPMQEITAERFEEMLNVLPPLHWVEINGVAEFCMSEMFTGSYTNQYAHDRKTGKYYQKLVDVTDRDTWIHKILERGGA